MADKCTHPLGHVNGKYRVGKKTVTKCKFCGKEEAKEEKKEVKSTETEKSSPPASPTSGTSGSTTKK